MPAVTRTRSCLANGNRAGSGRARAGIWHTAPASTSIWTTAVPSAPVPPVTTAWRFKKSRVSMHWTPSPHEMIVRPCKVQENPTDLWIEGWIEVWHGYISVVFPSVARKVLIPLHGRTGSVPLRRADPAIGYVLTGKESTVHA